MIMPRLKLHPPGIYVSSHPLRLGEHFTVRFEQQPKSSVKVKRLIFRLACTEWATYLHGISAPANSRNRRGLAG